MQQSLLEAKIIPDWHVGLQSRDIEWVEHRHWEFSCEIPAGRFRAGEQLQLDAEGLDYSGWILIDNQDLGTFRGALTPHQFDLTSVLSDGKAHQLRIFFDVPPPEDGQTGHSSQSKYFKPRYSYSWDWCPRIVPIGIWDSIWIRSCLSTGCHLTNLRSELAEDLRTGNVHVLVTVDPSTPLPAGATLNVSITDSGQAIASQSQQIKLGRNAIHLPSLVIRPWQPNGRGDNNGAEAKTYLFQAAVLVDGRAIWSEQKTIGFRRVEWESCEGAPAGAEPWICVINGERLFLQGVNWTPVTDIYHDTTPEQYANLIQMYREMGCNLLRVWGGAYLEREVFYDLCDRAGLLVWQEFPLAASGVDNWPPEDPAAISELSRIASSYIARRGHHASLFQWCGGNELQGGLDGGKIGSGKPVDRTHPAMHAMDQVVQAEDPGRRFIPTSSSGPRFMAFAPDFGKGLHHDVHGPWALDSGGMDDWKKYWDGDDALFRSEVGAPGPSSLETLKRYAGDEPLWPPTSDYWNHTAAWWIQWPRFQKILESIKGEEGLITYVESFQKEQAEALAYAARRTKSRFPACGGFIVWMGHDCFPVPSNTAIIEFGARPKPAYWALKRVFTGK